MPSFTRPRGSRLLLAFAVIAPVAATLASVEAQIVVAPRTPQPVATLPLSVGDSVRLFLGRERFDARFAGWYGDTLYLEHLSDPTYLTLANVDLLLVRSRSPKVALITGAIGGGIGGLVGHSLYSVILRATAGHDEGVPSRTTLFWRGVAFGASLSLLHDYVNPKFRTRYERARGWRH